MAMNAHCFVAYRISLWRGDLKEFQGSPWDSCFFFKLLTNIMACCRPAESLVVVNSAQIQLSLKELLVLPWRIHNRLTLFLA